MSRCAVLSNTENYEYCDLKERKNINFQVRRELRSAGLLRSGVVPKRRQEITATRCVITQKGAGLIFFAAET